MSKFTFDAQAALGFLTSQTSHIETQVNEVKYADIQYANLIPVDTSADEFSKTVTYYSSDKFGAAGFINGNGNDMPLAGTELAKHEASVHMAGIGYGYGYDELGQAQQLGRNLQADDAMAARRAYEEMVDRVAFKGDTEKNFSGLINNSAVTASSAVTGTWNTATVDQIFADINAALESVRSATNSVALADTVLLPASVFQYLMKPMSNSSMPILEYIKKYNLYTATTGLDLTIRAINGLETAGASDTKRMVVYRRDPQVLKLHIPMVHRFLPVMQSGALSFVVPGVFRLGGLDIRRPKEVRYVDSL
jgi:hypothetical protein